MARIKGINEEDEKVDLTDRPLTAGVLLDVAIAALDLPKREGRSVDAWVDDLKGELAKHHGRLAVAAAASGDINAAKHHAWQAETEHMKADKRPKPPSQV